VLRTACAMLDEGETIIDLSHLPQDFFDEQCAVDGEPLAARARDNTRLDDLALSAVSAALAKHNGNVSAAARMLGVSRNTLYRKMALLGTAARGAATERIG
jgi:transcriptional regulator of acetoin/glycerol metabolism